MLEPFSIFCDESCHLNNPDINIMGFGAICIDDNKKEIVKESIAKIKKDFNCKGEMKWIKVSPKNIEFYKRIVDFFIEESGLEFHSVIIQDKNKLDHKKYNNNSSEIFYYKMYFLLLKNIISRRRDSVYKIFLDIKDKHNAYEINQMKTFITRKLSTENEVNIKKIQTIDSDKVSILQLTDFLLGALMYANRFSDRTSAKGQLVGYIENKLLISLIEKTKYSQKKYHIFTFSPEIEVK